MKRLMCILVQVLVAGVLYSGCIDEVKAQCNGAFGANQVCGSVAGGAPGPVNSTSFPIGIVVGTTTITGGSSTGVLYNNSGVVGADAGLTWVPGGPLSILGTNSSLISGANSPALQLIQHGSVANPVTTGNLPTVQISRIESMTSAGCSCGDGSGGAALNVNSQTNNTQQANAFKATVTNISGATGDNVAVYAVAVGGGTASSSSHSYAGFFDSTVTSAGNYGIAIGTAVFNNTAANVAYNTASFSNFTALDAVMQTTNGSSLYAGVAIQIRGSTNAVWDVGLAALPLTGGNNSIRTALIQDDSNSATVLLVHGGSHSTGIDLTGGTYSVNQINGTGFSVSGAGTLTVTPAAGGSAVAGFKNTSAAQITIVNFDSVASQSAQLRFADAGSLKWALYKAGSDLSFRLQDTVLGKDIIVAPSNASGEVDFGVAGSLTGLLCIAGGTSGKACQTVAVAAGTPTITWGSSTGTPAVTASSPLAISTSTGNITIGAPYGATTYTLNGVLYGNSSSNIQVTAQGGANTVLAANAGAPAFTAALALNTSLAVPIIGPLSDSTTAIKITKADLSTAIITIDTTNKRVGINKTPGAFDLDVNGAVNFASTLAVTGHVTLEGVTSTGATGTGQLVFATSPVIGGSGSYAGSQVVVTRSDGSYQYELVNSGANPNTYGFAVSTADGSWQFNDVTAGKRRLSIFLSGGVTVGTIGTIGDPGLDSLGIGAQLYMPNITGVGVNENGYICYISGGSPAGKLVNDSTTCLASLRQWKKDIVLIDNTLPSVEGDVSVLSILENLKPSLFDWREPKDANQRGQQIGMIAEDVLAADPRLASFDSDGGLHGWKETAVLSLLVRGWQILKADNDNLRADLAQLRKAVGR